MQYTQMYLQVHTYIQNWTYIPRCISMVAKLLGYIRRLETRTILHYIQSALRLQNPMMNGVNRNNLRHKHSVWAKYRDFNIKPGGLYTSH
jgi:hypothetical protein